MKDILEKILAYLPRFFSETGFLFIAPKRFATEKVQADDPFLDALVYTAITIALLSLLPLPLYHQKDIWASVATLALQSLLSLGIAAPLCRLIWRLVGAQGHSKQFFAIYLYQNALMSIVYSIFVLVSFGYLYMRDPHTAEIVATANKEFNLHLPTDVAMRPDVLIFNGIQFIGIVFYIIWQIIAWGAYRHLYGVGRGRSAVAMVLYFISLVPATGLAVLAIFALSHMSG